MGEEYKSTRGLTGYPLWNVRPIFLAVLGLAMGIALCFYVRPNLGICFLACLGLLVYMLWMIQKGRRGFFVMMVLIMVGIGWMRTSLSLENIIQWPETGNIQGDICQIEREGDTFTVLLNHVSLNGQPMETSLRVRTKSKTMEYAEPGDVLSGYAFSIWTAETNSVWDKAQRYTNHWDALAWIGKEDVSIMESEFRLAYFPAKMRTWIGEKIDRLFGSQADAVKGMILGDKSDLSEEDKSVYERAGISHILAVSGLHVGFLGMLVSGALKRSRLREKSKLLLLLSVLWGYCAVVGFPVSTVRATVMVSVRQWNLSEGRRTDLLENLSLAALLILVWNPLQLLTPGFQLSFAAVWGLATVSSAISSRRKQMTYLGKSLSTSFGAQLGIWPISLSFFGGISTISLLANLFVIPLASLITAGTFIVLMVDCVIPSLAIGLANVVSGIVLLMNQGVFWISQVPGALVTMPPWPLSTTLLFLASLFFLSPYCLWKTRDRWTVVGLCWTVALLLAFL